MNFLNKIFFKKYLKIEKLDFIVAEGRRINLVKWDLKKQKQRNKVFVNQLIYGGLCASMKRFGEFFVFMETTTYNTKYFLPILYHEVGHIVNSDYEKIDKKDVVNGLLMSPEKEIKADKYSFKQTGVKMSLDFLKAYFVNIQEYVFRVQNPYLFEGDLGLDSNPDEYKEWKHEMEEAINERLIEFHSTRFNLTPSKK